MAVKMRPLLLMLASLAAVHGLSPPTQGTNKQDAGTRIATLSWVNTNVGASPSSPGYIVTITADDGATEIATELFVGPACDTVAAGCVTEYAFSLDPGDTAEYSVWTLEADNSTKVTPPLRASMVMPPTAPDPIGSSWAASDSVIASWNLDGPPYGRYVRLQFTIPEANGDDIQKFLIARNDGGAGASDYTLCCPSTATSPACTSSVGIKWWSQNNNRCVPGRTLQVYIGCTHPDRQDAPTRSGTGACTDADALTPESTYTWKIIARNSQNSQCRDDGNCATQNFGNWSPILTVAQGKATPNLAAAAPTGAVTTTTIPLNWQTPVDNGAALVSYRFTCADNLNYLIPSWKPPTGAPHRERTMHRIQQP